MLTDNQSLLLCGLIVGGIFVSGLLGTLDNFLVLTILTILFLAIVVNLFVAKTSTAKEKEVEVEAEE